MSKMTRASFDDIRLVGKELDGIPLPQIGRGFVAVMEKRETDSGLKALEVGKSALIMGLAIMSWAIPLIATAAIV